MARCARGWSSDAHFEAEHSIAAHWYIHDVSVGGIRCVQAGPIEGVVVHAHANGQSPEVVAVEMERMLEQHTSEVSAIVREVIWSDQWIRARRRQGDTCV